MSKPELIPDDDYRELLEELKQQIRTAQVKAALAVNRELLLLYWQIGCDILVRQQAQGWGAKVIARLSKDLKQEFPEMKGFSARNLGYMKTLAEAWPEESILQEVLAKIPWYHNITLLEKLKNRDERLWYAQKVIENGWSRSVLVGQIENGLYQEKKGIVTNFEQTLPRPQSDLAHQLIKDPYHFDFLLVEENIQHQDLKRYVIAHMREFLLELGIGFSFVRRNYPISVGGQDFNVDMLFYHLKLRCFIVIQLEIDEFRPEQSGRMNFYLSAIDDAERGEYDQPTIGIILCKTKDRTIAEYSLRSLQNPIAVAEHRLPKTLPSKEQLESELENAVREIGGEPES
ncbi:PDDEXK nuclease domain-containing protein [Oscillatoria sp. CS-180]|uniref:PDDEXK nuclease domain-containing protein n=1 Tax=Oscillatoria sp. CS-180 TaxID=3021720 RepID=UPI00232C9B22|nr:PDDEXK nuclease domain-containing protein [Oscillatoria sp. CS-180]MDB9526998.1 PDDEXK nuclease domain-containing protein [Oscillatoria sp. CS-180]